MNSRAAKLNHRFKSCFKKLGQTLLGRVVEKKVQQGRVDAQQLLMHRCGLSMRMSAFLTLMVLLAFISLIGLLVVNSFSTFLTALPEIESRLYEQYWNLLNALSSRGLAINPDQINSLFEGEPAWQSLHAEHYCWVAGYLYAV